VTVRRITVVTGTRAEYGLLAPLMKSLRDDPRFALSVIATGTHLEAAFGGTIDEIKADGIAVDHEVPLHIEGDSPTQIAAAAAAALSGVAEVLAELNPDILVLLGDRYEILATAFAGLLSKIPIAHIHGGETTRGAMDECMRHAISKMAHFHFTIAEAYRRRLIQLGEAPEHVFDVGAPCLDTMASVSRMDRPALMHSLNLDEVDRPFFLVTFHPETLGERDPRDDVTALTRALDRFRDHRVIVTGVNADPGNRAVSKAFEDYRRSRGQGVVLVDSLGYARYVSALHLAAAVIGNSSSGILEAPAAGAPSVNIGERQAGRLRAASVIDCAAEPDEIAGAISTALDPAFRAKAAAAPYPFGTPGAATRMRDILATVPLEGILAKTFHDADPYRTIAGAAQ
jgi:UDP-hydrolysing UDP-N-acetyl-D-glucosamine 2-epimerase